MVGVSKELSMSLTTMLLCFAAVCMTFYAVQFARL